MLSRYTPSIDIARTFRDILRRFSWSNIPCKGELTKTSTGKIIPAVLSKHFRICVPRNWTERGGYFVGVRLRQLASPRHVGPGTTPEHLLEGTYDVSAISIPGKYCELAGGGYWMADEESNDDDGLLPPPFYVREGRGGLHDEGLP